MEEAGLLRKEANPMVVWSSALLGGSFKRNLLICILHLLVRNSSLTLKHIYNGQGKSGDREKRKI